MASRFNGYFRQASSPDTHTFRGIGISSISGKRATRARYQLSQEQKFCKTNNNNKVVTFNE
jgi:hypothetical protein